MTLRKIFFSHLLGKHVWIPFQLVAFVIIIILLCQHMRCVTFAVITPWRNHINKSHHVSFWSHELLVVSIFSNSKYVFFEKPISIATNRYWHKRCGVLIDLSILRFLYVHWCIYMKCNTIMYIISCWHELKQEIDDNRCCLPHPLDMPLKSRLSRMRIENRYI